MRRKPTTNRNSYFLSRRVAVVAGAWKRLGIAVLMTATVGFTGCQTFRFPTNPFAGGKLPGARLPIPRLPSLAKLPKPNFGNIANAIKTPAQQAVGASVGTVASAKRQPPPAPNRKFDSTSTDQKLAESLRSKETEKPDFDIAQNEAKADLTPAQKRFKAAISKHQAKDSDLAANKNANPNPGLWGDYKPDLTPSSSNNPAANNLEELAKVNRGLYDQYGKLTTGNSSPKLSAPLDPKMFAAKTRSSEADEKEPSVAQLKSQLEKLKARGTGSSDEFFVPSRSAIEMAGTAAPAKPKAEASLHKGFGGSDQLKPSNLYANQGTVNIPDPTAPTNVLRASANQIPGLVQATNVEGPGKYSSTSYGGYGENKLDPSDLPSGGLLPEGNEDRVENKFAKVKQPQEIPTLTATSKPKEIEALPLPREISDASRAALAESARAAAAAPKPKITFQNPITQKSIAMPEPTAATVAAAPAMPPAPVATPAASVASTPAVSAFNLPATQSPRVTKNQFFSTPMKSSVPLDTPAVAAAPATPAARVARVEQDFAPLSIMSDSAAAPTSVPSDLLTGDSAYAPGSVVKPKAQMQWR